MEKKPTPSQIKKLALEIREFLIDRDMWIDTRIYFNGVAFDSDTGETLDNMNPRDYTEYAGDILTMTFEGPLYEALNYGDDGNYGSWRIQEQLEELFRKYGLYYELGHAWDLSAFPI